MKKTIIITSLLIASSCMLLAQTSVETGTDMKAKFISAMEANLKLLDTASTPETFIMLANNFDRIGKAAQKQWQPFYFAALCYGIMASNVPDKSKIDFLAEKAESYLALADALEKNNSEISTLRGMLLYTRVLVDPINRWQAMGQEAQDHLAKAKEQNPANPRPYLIEARAKLHTPEAMGGGPKAAKPIIAECLNKAKAFLPENSISPNWGKQQAEKLAQAVTQ
jgi:hypothetical protein